MRKLGVTIIMVLGVVVSMAAQTTQKLTATKASEYGIIYSLPTTVVDITIETQTIVKRPGEFYRYAKKYLNADDAISVESQATALKSITVNSRGVANAEQQYLMQFKAGSTPFLIVNDEQLPIAINAEETAELQHIELPKAVAAKPTPLESDAAQQVISGEMAQSQSLAKRAEIAASQLFALRQTRSDLLTCEADQMPPDGKAMELVLNNLQAQEAALLAMFMGTTQISTAVKTVTYIPDEDVENEVLARISAVDGVVDAGNLAGVPIYISLKVVEKGELPINEKGEVKTFPNGGVAYVIPGKVEISIDCEGKTFYNKQLATAQHGVVFGLDPKMFADKKSPAYLLFNPVTGAIKELGAVSNLPQ